MERSNEINKSEVLALRAHLAGLSRHCVYGFYNKDKQLMYVGQTTDFNQRASKHLGIALENRDQSDVKFLQFLKLFKLIFSHIYFTNLLLLS